MRNSRSVGGVDGRPSVLSCRAACLIPSVSSLSSPLTIHAHTLFRLLPLPSHSFSLPLTPRIDPSQPRRPSVITRAPSSNTRCIRFHLDTLRQDPPAQPQTIPNPPSSKPAPFPKNQPVASTRPPVQVLHAAFRPDSVLLPLLASLVLPWHAAQRTHSFLLYIILPGTRQPTRASYYKLTDADCSASAGVRVRRVRVCACVCVRACCVRVCNRARLWRRSCPFFPPPILLTFAHHWPALSSSPPVAQLQAKTFGGDSRHFQRTRHFLAVRPSCY